MQRVLKLTKQNKQFVRSSSVKGFDRPVKVFFGADSEANKLTTENFAKDFEAKFGPPKKYVKKHEMDMSVVTKIKEFINHKRIDSPVYFEIIKQAGGYESVEEVKKIYNDTTIFDLPLPKIPSYASKPLSEWPKNAQPQKVDPKLLEALYSMISKSEREALEDLIKGVEQFEAATEKEMNATMDKFDWLEAEKKVGEEEAFKMREQLHHSIKTYAPSYNNQKVLELFYSYVKPELDAIGDQLAEIATSELERVGKLHKNSAELILFDHYSLPYQLNSYEYIDKYMPQARDEILLEIEKGDFDPYYKERYKQFKHVQNIENAWAKTEEIRLMRDKVSDKKDGQSEGRGELNESQQLLENLFVEFQKQVAVNKSMEMEISNLKKKIEETRGGRKRAVATETTTNTVETATNTTDISEDEWVKFFKASGNSEEQILSSFARQKAEQEERAKKAAESAAARAAAMVKK